MSNQGDKDGINEKSEYWFELVEYDIETARAMLKTKRYLYVGFMCHQSVEKALKAVISNKDETPPKTHNLAKLAQTGNIYDSMNDEQQDFLDELDPLNIAARYPEKKSKLSEMLNEKVCEKILNDTEEFITWIKEQL